MTAPPPGVALRLAELVRHRTVSDEQERDENQFTAFRRTLRRLYPRIHTTTRRLPLPDNGSLLFHWPGRSDRHPVVLMAHHDVVPAQAERWRHAPFAGTMTDGVVHGRGTLDDKGALACLLDAVEELIGDGHVPAQDIYLFSGADEETHGAGARLAAEWMRDQGVRPWLVSDEGGAIAHNLVPGVSAPLAMVAVAEKGTVDLELVSTGAGGHSSVPERGSAIERLAEAVTRVCRSGQDVRLDHTVRSMLQALDDVPALQGLVLLPDLELADRLRSMSPEMAALTTTTMAVTRLGAGHGDNVIADRAVASVNVRLAPGDAVDTLVTRLKHLLGDLDVQVCGVRGDPPSPASATEGPQWELLRHAVAAVDPDLRVVPYLQSGSTDSRYFATFADAVHRFAPLRMSSAQRGSIHGVDEHVTFGSLSEGVTFYRTLITGLPES